MMYDDDEPNVVLSAGPVYSRDAERDDPPYVQPTLQLGFTLPAPTYNPVDVDRRAQALIVRGVDPDLAADVRWCGDRSLLAQLERATPEDISKLNTLWRERRDLQRAVTGQGEDDVNKIRAAIADLQAEAAAVVESGRAFEQRRCRRLCCPVNGVHDRTHPLCVVMPVLWAGDQA